MKTFMKALSVLLLVPFFLQAQSDEDALRYSQLSFGGTARFMGLSGAFGALGGDFGSLSGNPAGIGLYRTSEFSLTPAVTGSHVEANFLGNVSSGQAYPFNIASGGIVISGDLTKKNPNNLWKRINFGFGANRLNDFNSETYFTGYNNSNSLVDYYVEQANQGGGTAPSQITSAYPFGAGLFYQAYLINPDISDSNTYTTAIDQGNIQQSGYLSQSGNITEYLFSLGSNYNDHLLLGMSVGMPAIHYNLAGSHSETDINNMHSDFNNFMFRNYLTTNGNGFNAKFGATYIFNDYLRVGAAIHTPTYYWMHDDYSATIHSDLNSVGGIDWSSPQGSYNYDLVTPWRAIGSIAAYYKKYGFISLDYELVDYGAMSYHFKKNVSVDEKAIESSLNQTINKKYGMASNVRLGAELAYDMFRLRGGAAYYGSPFQANIATGNNDFSSWSFSGGAGIRGKHAFFDAAYVRTKSNQFYQPYTLADQAVPGVALNKVSNNFVATLGLKF